MGMFIIPLSIFSQTGRGKIKSPLSLERLKKRSAVKGEYIVLLRSDEDEDFILSYFSSYRVIKFRRLSRGTYFIKLADDPGFDTLMDYALKDERISGIQPNFLYQGSDE